MTIVLKNFLIKYIQDCYLQVSSMHASQAENIKTFFLFTILMSSRYRTIFLIKTPANVLTVLLTLRLPKKWLVFPRNSEFSPWESQTWAHDVCSWLDCGWI